jgi:hypothetical protein
VHFDDEDAKDKLQQSQPSQKHNHMSPSNLSIKTKTMSTMKTKKPKNPVMSYQDT